MTKSVRSMSDIDLLASWAQYGRPGQACFYPGLRGFRRALWGEIKRRGLRPPTPARYPRPKGYGGKHGGYMFLWGIGGDFRAPKLPRFPRAPQIARGTNA